MKPRFLSVAVAATMLSLNCWAEPAGASMCQAVSHEQVGRSWTMPEPMA